MRDIYRQGNKTILTLMMILFLVSHMTYCQGEKFDDIEVEVTEDPIPTDGQTTPNDTTDSIVPDDPEEELIIVEHKTFNVRNLQTNGCKLDGFQLNSNLAGLINDNSEEKIIWIRNPGFPYSNTNITTNEVLRDGEIWIIENGGGWHGQVFLVLA